MHVTYVHYCNIYDGRIWARSRLERHTAVVASGNTVACIPLVQICSRAVTASTYPRQVESQEAGTNLRLLLQQRLRIQKSWHQRLQLPLMRPMPLQMRPVAYGVPGGVVAHTLQSLQMTQQLQRQKRRATLCKYTHIRVHRRCTSRLPRFVNVNKQHHRQSNEGGSRPTSASMATATRIVLLRMVRNPP